MSLLTKQRLSLLNRHNQNTTTTSTNSLTESTEEKKFEKPRPRLSNRSTSHLQNAMDRMAELSMMQDVEEHGIKILIGYSFCRIAYPKVIINKVADKFSAYVRGAQFSPSVQMGRWDGRKSMVNKRDGSFGIGLLGDVLGFLKYELKIPVALINVEDLREKPEKTYNFKWNTDKPFRRVQEEALDRLRNTELGILRLPTASGKSFCCVKMIQELGVRTLFCVPSKELLYQTVQVIKNLLEGPDLRVGLLGDGNFPEDYDPIVVAMYPSLTSLRGDSKYSKEQFIESMSAFDLLICDECHKICSRDQITKTWETIMDINAYYRYGVSATPFEKEDTIAEMLIRSAFGHLAYSISMEEARNEHIVTPFTVVFLKPNYPPEMKRGNTGMNFNDAHEYFIGNNLERNSAIVQTVTKLLQDNRKTLVVAQRINHNELLAKMLAESLGEDNVYLLHGALERDYRQHSLKEFKERHDPCVMVASAVGNDGIDIPDISGIVLAHGGKSFFQNVQRAGRGLRVADGKRNLIFVDFDDAELGRWFKNHTVQRAKYYKDLGATIASSIENAIKGSQIEQ